MYTVNNRKKSQYMYKEGIALNTVYIYLWISTNH
jgi:hypothetical protein